MGSAVLNWQGLIKRDCCAAPTPSCTLLAAITAGIGEQIMKSLLAKRTADELAANKMVFTGMETAMRAGFLRMLGALCDGPVKASACIKSSVS